MSDPAVIKGAIIPKLIDEIPVIAAAACYASGETVIADAAELRVKESDRIKTMAAELGRMGATVIQTDDGMIILGGVPLHGAVCEQRPPCRHERGCGRPRSEGRDSDKGLRLCRHFLPRLL